MKGKKLLLIAITFAMLVGVASVFGVGFKIERAITPMANAKDIAGFSQAYDKTTSTSNDVIFSVEKVYFASNTEDRGKALKNASTNYDFKSMQNYNNTSWYYGDYELRDEIVSGSYDNKYVVKNNDFVIVDDKKTISAEHLDSSTTPPSTENVNVKEGLLITLGGYYYNGTVINTTTDNAGANLELVSVTAWRNTDESGTPILLNGNRTYNSRYYDFVWFLEANESTEGHYHLKIEYLQTNGSKQTQYFDFYMLLKSNYDDKANVNGYEYTYAPTMDYVNGGNRKYTYNKDSNTNYPTLTFDYTRYDMSYTYITGDETRKVEFDYNQVDNALTLSTSIYNTTTTKPYQIKYSGNRFVTLMFTEIGKYTFEFEYLYNDGKSSTIVENLSVEDIELTIHGYQLKYSKLGASSADMEYIEVVENGTICIVVNGYTDAEKFTKDDDLGVNYSFVQQGGKTGNVYRKESGSILKLTNSIEYVTTNQAGLWFDLNDTYDLVNSKYYYAKTEIKVEATACSECAECTASPAQSCANPTYIFKDSSETPVEITGENFTKVTRFTEKGFYLVQVAYKISGDNKIYYQYFAFEITSKTPMMDMHTIDIKNSNPNHETDMVFHSNKYTNKNVYAYWETPDRFESKLYAKVYQGNNGYKYPTEQELITVATGGSSTNIQSYNYNKLEILDESGSYLISLEVENSSTKVFSYFVIDKEKISGVEIYETRKYYTDNKLNYEIARDGNLNAITYTTYPIIDIDFTIGWSEKTSGANIYGTYKFAPFVKQEIRGTEIENGQEVYQPNYYKLGEFSNPVSIESSKDLHAIIGASNVLTDQGIYIFELVDDAGNELSYMMVLDRTEAVIDAKAGGKEVLSGSTITENVDFSWGTHKAINIDNDSDIIQDLLNGTLPEDYYQEGNTNRGTWGGMFYNGSQKLLLVENNYAQIKFIRDENENAYRLYSNNNKLVYNKNGNIIGSWDSDTDAKNRFVSNNNHSLTIKLDEVAKRIYQLELFGRNVISNTSSSNYIVTLNPDIAKGEVYSTTNEGIYETEVAEGGVKPNDLAKSSGDKSFTSASIDKDIDLITTKNTFGKNQLSDDRLFTFTWTTPTDSDVKVLRVWYNYYRLMSQNELNAINYEDETSENYIGNYPYYPYVYEKSENIMKLEGEEETVSNYSRITINNESRCQSNALNIGYETYYENGELVSKTVTKSGLYIITRELTGNNLQFFSYAFMVDRNEIIEYSLGDSTNKLVGQFIHTNFQDVAFDNFSIQGLKGVSKTIEDASILTYKVYAETNKLPTKIQVPTGKYVGGNKYSINKTSYNSSYLTLSIYFSDDYDLLEGNNNFIKLMTKEQITSDGYININYKNVEQEYITLFKQARVHNDDQSLSLPGTYVFVIEDTVGKELDEYYNVIDNNSLIIGIKLTNNAPITDVYSYAEMNGNQSNKEYNQGTELFTNQEFVDFVIPKVDNTSLQSQLDQENFEVYQDNKLWLKLVNNELIVNLSGKERKDLIITKEDGSIVVKLDTGLVLNEDGSINSYAEYEYRIKVQYILKDSKGNDYTQYYIYNKNGETQFHTTTYVVTIDRTPETNNINNILTSQNSYFNTYIKQIAYENGIITNVNDQYSINNKFVYRSYATTQDYYAYSNNLYYDLINTITNSSNLKGINPSIYAITINKDTKFNKNNISKVYYREIDVTASIDASSRMGLLPIISTYFGNSSGFYQFSPSSTSYTNSDLQNKNLTYGTMISDTDKIGKFYEIVEVDKAGNLTQYVVYMAKDSNEVKLTIDGTNAIEGSTNTVAFTDQDSQRTFVGIDKVTISGLGQGENVAYGKIEIIDGINQILLSKFINTTTKASEISNEITGIVNNIGNYTIRYTDLYNNTYSIYIDNYSSTDLVLNSSALVLLSETTTDGERYYIDIASVNNKVDNLTLYAKTIRIYRGSEYAEFNGVYDRGSYTLQLIKNIEGLSVRGSQIILGGPKAQFSIVITDVLDNKYRIAVSTDANSYLYKIAPETNYYAQDNIIYTAGDVKVSYYNSFYNHEIKIYKDDSTNSLTNNDSEAYYDISVKDNYTTLVLKAVDESYMKYIVVIKQGSEELHTYVVVIDTRTTIFNIKTINLEDMSNYVKHTFSNINELSFDNLDESEFYNDLIAQTVNISWTILTNHYFNYQYQLVEYTTSDSYEYLVNSNDITGYPLRPKASTDEDPTTGKYILKVTITGKNNVWIASKAYAVRLTTTISSLYEVKDIDGNVYNYSTVSNLNDILKELDISGDEQDKMWKALDFTSVEDMNKKFDSFGRNTAVPMYLSIKDLDIHTNLDNGVEANYYQYDNIRLYKIESSNYRTFALIVKVADAKGNLLSDQTLYLSTNANTTQTYLISRSMVTIHEPTATRYMLNFKPYNEAGSTKFAKNNKIVIDIYYNDKLVKTIKGDGDEPNSIEFKTAGTYTLKVSDLAGNYQKFGSSDSVVIKVMKGVLFTINKEAPIQYAYYDKSVDLTINANTNYEQTSVVLTAYLNNNTTEYTGYSKNGSTYTFSDYGTYVIKIKARLSNSEYEVSSQIVFTILNPNEARSALDFTVISNYNIISILDVSAGEENAKDVTKQFNELFNTYTTADGTTSYSKLITHEKLVEKFGALQGKMKFKVKYAVKDDDLLPERIVEFSFTSNNETPTITCSVPAGTKTTKAVTITFNPWIIYQQMGECNIVINDVVVYRITKDTAINEIKSEPVDEVGQYYITVQGDSGNVATSFHFTIKEPLNTMSIILIVIVSLIVIGLVVTFIWLRTKMKVR